MIGLAMGHRQAVTRTIATRHKRASRAEKGTILDELCAMTCWHRNQARGRSDLGGAACHHANRYRVEVLDEIDTSVAHHPKD